MSSIHTDFRKLITLVFVTMTLFTNASVADDSCANDSERIAGQVGSNWDRVLLLSDNDATLTTDAIKKVALGVALYRGGTAFYLGKFNGHYLMATNYHIQPKLDCFVSPSQGTAKASFQLLQQTFTCEKVFGSWKDIDLAVFSITVPQENQFLFVNLGSNFSYGAALSSGELLTTLGYGIACDSSRKLTITDGADCEIFSGNNEVNFIADPDWDNTDSYSTWAFAMGCNASHGDSGSPVLSRITGEVIGILYTGHFPKSATIQNDSTLLPLVGSDDSSVWSQLNYAVPAVKIREIIQNYLSTTQGVDPDTEATLTDFTK